MNPVINFRLAVKEDLPAVYELNDRFNLKNIHEADRKFGFVTNTYSLKEIAAVIDAHDMIVMTQDDKITGCLYVINALPQSDILRTRWQNLVDDNKVPADSLTGFGARIIISKETRHFFYPVHLFKQFFALNSDRYSCLFSGINKANDVSLKALVKAYQATIIDESPEYIYILFNKDHTIPLVSNNYSGLN